MKRCQALKLPCDFSGVESVDIYKRIKPWKKHLGLENLKQKTIEAFLSICREDRFGGGQLIGVYEDYLKTRDESLLRLLLLHNEEDLKGMPSLLPILFYPDFFTQNFTLLDLKKAAGETPRLLLSLKGEEETVLPRPLCAAVPSYGFAAAGNALELSIRLYEGTLKYYYPNYKDYYYLIYEDTAVHKSVGEYVDRDARIKATKETCYTKKSGVFLPQPEPVWTPDPLFSKDTADTGRYTDLPFSLAYVAPYPAPVWFPGAWSEHPCCVKKTRMDPHPCTLCPGTSWTRLSGP